MKFEQQLEELAKLGIRPERGIGPEYFLRELDREAYEDPPFDVLLTSLGMAVQEEPYDRPVCSRVWDFDTECINDTGDYVAIVHNLLRVAGKPMSHFKDI